LGSYSLFSHYLVGAAVISGSSMLPTLKPGQVCLIRKWSYLVAPPERGDVVVFKHPELGGWTVKRVVGLPGDHILFRYPRVYVNGAPIDESYLQPGDVTTSGRLDEGPHRVPAGHLFVLGDNRNASEDSRTFGMVRTDWVVGRIAGGTR
jgi:signal peptidase I